MVVGHGSDTVRQVFAGDDDDIRYALQAEQLGTGHATLCAKDALAGFDGDVLVLAGDGPLIRSSTLKAMHRRHVESSAAATLATSVIEDPTGYGRIVRDPEGQVERIVEEKDATPEIRTICEAGQVTTPPFTCSS